MDIYSAPHQTSPGSIADPPEKPEFPEIEKIKAMEMSREPPSWHITSLHNPGG